MQHPKENHTCGNKSPGSHSIADSHSQSSVADPDAIDLRSLSQSASQVKLRDDFVGIKSLLSTPKRVLLRHGWRFAAVNYALAITVVFLCNLTVTAWGSHKNMGPEFSYTDSCKKVSNLNTWLHWIINFLSTILLSESNYCMQCLSAPTRSEVDQAHAKGVWLDIGVPSTRNLRHISKRRLTVWVLLGLSSLPLHLFYNSMVYSSIAHHEYIAFSVPEAFTIDQNCLNCDKIDTSVYFASNAKEVIIDLQRKARNNELTRLEPKDCIKEYAIRIQSFRRNVLLVGSDETFPPPDARRTSHIGRKLLNDTRVYDLTVAIPSDIPYPSYIWICQEVSSDSRPTEWCQSYVDEVNNGAEWIVDGFKVDYCLSEIAPPLCKLHILLSVGWLVTILNLFKACLIYYTVFIITDDPIMTMGDAVTSFIERPDPSTKGQCLLTINEATKQLGQPTAKQWRAKANRWKDTTSRTRRFTTIAMCMVVLLIVSVLLNLGVESLNNIGQSTFLPSLAEMGLGATDSRTIINWNITSTIGNIFMANLAQPVLSLLYFSYNGLFTCMLLGFEWSQYAQKRKGLRVSKGHSGAQRSTYFLQLPYRYSIPLLGISGLLHWLVSQSIFLVAIEYYDCAGNSLYNLTVAKLMTCGYSPIAIIYVLVVGILMVIAAIGAGYIPYKRGINLAGSCSASMSAACHSQEWDLANGYEAARSKLQWGVVGVREDGIGHCAFSMREVGFPVDGKKYA